jgi:PAS domain S-box-containing protein
MIAGTDLLAALPVAVYTTDAEGRITFYNEAAAELWGHRPEIGTSQWCGSWRLFWPDGRPLPHDECPMAVTLKEQRLVRGVEAIAERPDGTRVPFTPYPTLLRNEAGEVTGAINLLVNTAERKHAEIESARLAAIIASSDDAIISKNLDGRITSWNAGATRIFGYEADEMIGQSITRIIPLDLLKEEENILSKLVRGERIDHFDTLRVTKDGRIINVSLTVSPLRDKAGIIVGASKVARDVTERKRSEELQSLLFGELNHRVKNTLATIQAIASQSLRRSSSPEVFVTSFNGRIQALARAHDLLVQGKMKGADVTEIVREQVVLGAAGGTRITFSGPSVMLDSKAAVQLALVLHELATNARKHGALSVPAGKLDIAWTMERRNGPKLLIRWQESGVEHLTAPTTHGFGTTLIERTLLANGGSAAIVYGGDGVACEISLPLVEELEQIDSLQRGASASDGKPRLVGAADSQVNLRGKRILLIEDEPLIALETGSQLASAGCEVLGPAATLETARRLIATMPLDAAVVDANLAGQPVDELAATLTQRGIPFVFATGYGREGLPLGYRGAPALFKPFSASQLFLELDALFAELPSDVIPLRPKAV